MGVSSSLHWTCQGCGARNEQAQPLDLEVKLPLARNGVMRGAQVVHAIDVVPAACGSCGLVSLFDAEFIRAQGQ
jgi:hypothetical protein